MKTIRITLFVLTLITVCSCKKSLKSQTELQHKDSVVLDTTNKSTTTEKSNQENQEDTIANIKFQELTVSINRLQVYDKGGKIKEVQKDTVNLLVEIGECIEGQKITLTTDKLVKLTVEQCYETSITIMDEGPHCDLLNWKHYNSAWKPLKQNGAGQFVCEKYTEHDGELFPTISIDELKNEVKSHHGDRWFKLIEKVKSVTEYPCGVGISHYYLRIRGQRKDNGKMITKLIIVENPMGC